jgi:hypothetical protein
MTYKRWRQRKRRSKRMQAMFAAMRAWLDTDKGRSLMDGYIALAVKGPKP